MRALYSLWKGLVNIGLMLLPAGIVVFLAVQFGQPVVELYREYFLGNPARELHRNTQSLVRERGTEIPYRSLSRQFDGVLTLDKISDTDVSLVNNSLINIHRAVVKRLASGNLERLRTTASDSYARLLDNKLVDRVFGRADLVRNRLISDVSRLGKLPDLPDHPAEGLEAYWNSSDTVSSLVRVYGNLYANQVSCRQILDTSCGSVYNRSVELVGQYSSQFLSNWPEFSQSLSADPATFYKRIEPLYSRYEKFNNRLSDYLRAPPWADHSNLHDSFDKFRENYELQLQNWYGRVLANRELSSADFSERQWSPNFTTLRSLRDIQELISTKRKIKEVLLNEQNKKSRLELVQELENLYAKVKAFDSFDPDYEAADQALDSLEGTIGAFSRGKSMITEIDDSLDQSESIHRDLEDSLENENYSSMAQNLTKLRNRLVESESSQPWKTLARSFLTRTHDVVSRADWQPSSSEGHENYRTIINLYGDIAKEINLATINEKWISETLLALKSRRFNQIKQNVNQKMTNLNNEQNLKTVSSLLKDLTQLEELPGRLSTQVDQIIFQLALVEKLKTGSQNLRERFSKTITANSRFSKRWKEITDLISDAPSLKQLGNSGGFSIVNYVNRWQNWIESTKVSTEFGKMVRDQAVQVLRNNLDELLTELKNNIKISDESKPQTSSLMVKLKNLRNGLNKAGEIKTFEKSYDLSRWENVLSVRSSLETLLNTLENLKKGGLLGSNESFRKYRETLDEFEWEAFPLSYPARYERKAIRNIFGKVRDRSREIHRSSSQDWLPGWGGRVTADQILTPYLDFLTGVRSNLRHPKVSATVGEIVDSTEMLRNELIDSNE